MSPNQRIHPVLHEGRRDLRTDPLQIASRFHVSNLIFAGTGGLPRGTFDPRGIPGCGLNSDTSRGEADGDPPPPCPREGQATRMRPAMSSPRALAALPRPRQAPMSAEAAPARS